MPDEPVASGPSVSSKEAYLKAYEYASNYVIRELTLINNRLTWILTIHGFLYATYGFTLQKQMEIYEKIKEFHFHIYPLCDTITQSDIFLLLISLVGMAISYFGFISIGAACEAMHAVSASFYLSNKSHHDLDEDFLNADDLNRKSWYSGFYSFIIRHNANADVNTAPIISFYRTKYGVSLPHLLGGGLISTDTRGNRSSLLIPWILLIGWCISLIVLGLSWHSSRHIGCNFL